MCGRYTLRAPGPRLRELFDAYGAPRVEPRFNLAPSQPILAVRMENGKRTFGELRWGLVPSWANDPSIGSQHINARSESAGTKPTFREAFLHRRCLIPADGWYEWKKDAKPKRPFHITMKDGQPFAFAGLWEHWEGKGEIIESCAILTTDANQTLSRLHPRMPAVLRPEQFAAWLDPATPPDHVQALLKPAPDEWLKLTEVGSFVNAAAHEGEECLAPPDPERAEQGALF